MDELLTPQGIAAWIGAVTTSCGLFVLLTRQAALFQLIGLQLLLCGLAVTLTLMGRSLVDFAVTVPLLAIAVGVLGLKLLPRGDNP